VVVLPLAVARFSYLATLILIAAVVGAGVPFVKMRTETLAHRRKSIHSSVGKGLRPNDSSAWGTFALNLPLGRPKTQFLSHENRERP
jgi:hypothetical protein